MHGDYHLGQVLRVADDFAILDFEGEPARTPAERREKQSPLKDVAGMLRSFSYATWVSLVQFTNGEPEPFARLEPWARTWEWAASSVFLRAYRDAAASSGLLPPSADGLTSLLNAYFMEKALYEILYELNNRPAWVWIPLRGILTMRG